MLTRRTFLSSTAAAGLATFGLPGRARAQDVDVLIRGGRVIDPASNLDTVADVAIRAGRIAAVGPGLPASGAARIVDATGLVVTPGLVDVHAHARDAAAPRVMLSQGVTSLVDAGSAGADHIDDIVAIARQAPNRMRVLINIARPGIIPEGDLMNLAHADVDAARQAIARHRDIIIGVKARLSEPVAGRNDLEGVRRAVAAAQPFGLPVMVHVGQSVSPLSAILALLRPGDVVTHVYAPPPNGIFDPNGALFPEVAAARARGIWFDIGHGRTAHISWAMAEDGIRTGFLPDTISSDWTDAGRASQVIDLPNVLSKFLLLGLTLPQVIAMVTSRAAKVFAPFAGTGTLRAGAAADLALLEPRRGTFEFVDNFDTRRTGPMRLFPHTTFFAGVPSPAER